MKTLRFLLFFFRSGAAIFPLDDMMPGQRDEGDGGSEEQDDNRQDWPGDAEAEVRVPVRGLLDDQVIGGELLFVFHEGHLTMPLLAAGLLTQN